MPLDKSTNASTVLGLVTLSAEDKKYVTDKAAALNSSFRGVMTDILARYLQNPTPPSQEAVAGKVETTSMRIYAEQMQKLNLLSRRYRCSKAKLFKAAVVLDKEGG